MRACIIDEEAKARIKRVREHAEAEHNRFGPAQLLRMIRGKDKPPGDDPRHVCDIQVGFRAVYSVEDHGNGKGWMRHLSVSVARARPGTGPPPEAVAMIAQAFGFDIGDDMQFTESQYVFPSPTWGWDAPNVVELME